MALLDRRTFLLRSATAVGALSIAGSLQAYAANRARGQSVEAAGYGPLRDRGDLALPAGFDYRVISREGERMSDGSLTPSRFDGMGAFPGPSGSTILIRNHENRQSEVFPAPSFELPPVVPREMRYDPAPHFNGGDTKLVVSPDRRVLESFAVLGGTTHNCAGGVTPWGSWLACEEEFAEGDRRHGYVFEIDAGAPGPIEAVPIPPLGRFSHEAVAWVDGALYLTEDLTGNEVAFYRYVPDTPPRQVGDLARSSGELQALRVRDAPGLGMNDGILVGLPLGVEWVTLEEPDPEGNVLREEAFSKGAARFTREEGVLVGNGRVYFDCPEGGSAGQGQIWEHDPRQETIRLVYTSPEADALQGPDNLAVMPGGDILICEDPTDRLPYLRGLTGDGRVYPFARAIANSSEFCGACFSPDGSTLFVNQQGSPGYPEPLRPGVTYAIWGPFKAASSSQ
jgi:secreted PhoX family phosphatase